MSTLQKYSTLGAWAMTLAFGSWSPAFGQDASNATTAVISAPPPPDAGLFTSYQFPDTFQYAYVFVCGSTQEIEGCYGEYTLGPFGHIGALLEGPAAIAGNTVTRHLYIVDVATGTTSKDVTLYEYQRVDTITSTEDFVVFTVKKEIPLPLVGGPTAHCFIAANHKFLFIGTDKGPSAQMMEKENYELVTIDGFSNQLPVSSISTDDYGYVTVTFGPFDSGGSGFVVINSSGVSPETGGGAVSMLASNIGLSTSSLPRAGADTAAGSGRLEVKKSATR
jgi:hypothetical protein